MWDARRQPAANSPRISVRGWTFFFMLVLASSLRILGSQSIVLGWNPSPDSRVVGYFVYVEDQAGNPISRSDVGMNTTATISDLYEGNTYVFYVSAYGYDTYLDDTYVIESEPTNTVTYHVAQSAVVEGRYVFYNQSAFDGNDPASNASDDAAIAIDKSALLPGNI